jgi:hypothetical protein
MSITIPLVAADGAKSTVTVPNPTVVPKSFRRDRPFLTRQTPVIRYGIKPVGWLPTPKILSAITGVFTVVGKAVKNPRKRIVSVAAIPFTLTGETSTLAYKKLTTKTYVLSISPGSYSVRPEISSLKAHGVIR